MKKFLIATVIVASTASAQSADLSAKAPYYKAPAAQVYDWTGFYIGANVGIGVGRSLTSLSNTFGESESSYLSPLGVLGGAQVGYSRQYGNFLGLGNIVLGVETDIQATSLQTSRTCGGAVCPPGVGIRFDQSLDWFGTARGRVGLATGPVLSYVTGGLAFGHVKNGISSVTTSLTFQDETRAGWVIGSGIEAALGGNWTGKIEYLYVDLANASNTIGPETVSSNVRENIFRAGLNYRIGGNGAYAPTSAANWAGLYIGGNGGSGLARNQSSLATAVPPATPFLSERLTLSPDGYLGGMQIGYNWQAANWVYGLEADIQGSTQKDDKACVAFCEPIFAALFDQKMQWFGTLRGRLGYSIGSTLFYGTGGLAFGGVKTEIVQIGGGNTVDNTFSQTKAGWTAGGGVESPFEFLGIFGKNWTSKTEYLYADLGKTTNSYILSGATSTFTSHTQEHIFRTGLNYHFNAPVVAKY
jgi:outer membrane immunogenic protein